MRDPWFLKFPKILTLSLLLFSCQSEYVKLEERELASGKEVHELFLGLELGMERRTFYETCWQLNKEGKLTNGPTELSVEHSMELPSGNSVKMRFYPKFKDDKIYLMPMEFSYDAWAPWNENLNADRLREDVVKLFEQWYGPGFIEVTNEEKGQTVFVKMDGNRRIRVFKKHISVVRAEISDLPVEKKIKANINS